VNAYIDRHREVYGIEPICKVLQVAQSAYRRHAARQRCPELRSTRARNDEVLMAEIKRVWQVNMRVYGARKVWRQLQREGIAAARCTVERLMKRQGLQGARRGKIMRTTMADATMPCPLDRVNRQFKPITQTSYGFQISHMYQRGRAGRMWPLSSMYLPGASWAGA
jgi:hypothetical protein